MCVCVCHVSPPLQCCHCHLQCSDLEEEPMVQSLCAMVLLEGCSPRQAFAQFLLARKVNLGPLICLLYLGYVPVCCTNI